MTISQSVVSSILVSEHSVVFNCTCDARMRLCLCTTLPSERISHDVCKLLGWEMSCCVLPVSTEDD